MFCPDCGNDIPDKSKFCFKCGCDLLKIKDSIEDTSSHSEDFLDDMATIQTSDEETLSGEDIVQEDKDESLSDGKTIEVHTPITHDTEKYEIISTIGEGGMGKVYKARDNTLHRMVALKRLTTSLSGSQQAIDRFLNEARSIAVLNHPNIVQVYDFGEDTDGYFIAMEYVDGVSLKDYIKKKDKLTAEEATKIILNAAKGLSAAHEREITHRDIKPANILLDKNGIPKLTDFGLARITATGDMTLTGVMLGTPDYCSPEQLKDAKNVDYRTDIYLLGATLYEMVTGESPKYFREEHIPAGLTSTVKKAMESGPGNRYQSVLEFIDSFDVEMDEDQSTALKVACPKCGTHNPMEVKYCVKCGGDLSHLFIKCPKCEKENRVDVEFCGGCGYGLYNHRRIVKLTEQAVELKKEGKYAGSIAVLEKILEIDPNNENIKYKFKIMQARKKVKHILEVEKDPQKAKSVIDELRSKNIDIDNETDEIYKQIMDVIEKKTKLRNKLSKNPVTFEDLETQINSLTKIIESGDEEKSDISNFAKLKETRAVVSNKEKEAERLFDNGKYKEAIRIYDGIVKILPKYNLSPNIKNFKKRTKIKKIAIITTVTILCITIITVLTNHFQKRGISKLFDSINENMVFISGGDFQMGDTFGDGDNDEKPVHEVYVDDFYIGKYEVTQGQWKALMGENPSSLKVGYNNPVEGINWEAVQMFIGKLSQKTGKKYRLPTEAEWEYAARSGGKKEKWSGTSKESELNKFSWCDGKYVNQVHPVGQKEPNGLGLYDMSGNVMEWCQDWYDKNYYNNSPKHNPKGPLSGSDRVIRGGSRLGPRYLRASDRGGGTPNRGSFNLGFRLTMTL